MKQEISDLFPLSRQVIQAEIFNLESLLHFTQQLPYGRNKNRTDLSLVLRERKGTCSSKHAFVKKIAEENSWNNIQLFIGIYKMNHLNTPKIGNSLMDSGLEYIPEAHCYLKIDGQAIDITSPSAAFENVKNDILEEHEINSTQVNTFKVDLHQQFLKTWILENEVTNTFDEVWALREMCIENLSA